MLRRNIHRLEKGLCFETRKAEFAADFIGDTVGLFKKVVSDVHFSSVERKWAHDTLVAYFEAVNGPDPRINAARQVFQSLPSDPDHSQKFSPYLLGDLSTYVENDLPNKELPGAYTDFLKLAKSRRSQRYFENVPVPLSKIQHAVAAAIQAPSACNRQPFDFYLANERRLIDDIAAMPLGTKGFGHKLPMLIAVVGNLSNFSEPRDRHLIYIDAGLATMQLMLALTAIGLGSVPINWPDLPSNHSKLRSRLKLKEHQVPIMLLGIGVPKPDTRIAYSAKRTVEEVLHVVTDENS